MLKNFQRVEGILNVYFLALFLDSLMEIEDRIRMIPYRYTQVPDYVTLRQQNVF